NQIMKELVEFIARSIVDAPDDVKVEEETTEEGLTLKLQVADEDKGRVIGKQGRIAEAIRTLLRVKAAKAATKVRLEII
ncbi:MAG: KH domain-containing protein, partial [Dehalococcoidales bacterium]